MTKIEEILAKYKNKAGILHGGNEDAWDKSDVIAIIREACEEQKNLFGMGWDGKTYYSYKTYRASIAHYHKWEQRYIKKHSLIYAEDSLYAFKLKKIK